MNNEFEKKNKEFVRKLIKEGCKNILKECGMNKTIEVNLHADHMQQNQKWIELASEVHETKQLLKHYKLQEAKLLDSLKALSNNKSSVGGEYVFTGAERPGSINYKEIPELKAVNLDLYRKEPVMCWKLTKI